MFGALTLASAAAALALLGAPLTGHEAVATPCRDAPPMIHTVECAREMANRWAVLLRSGYAPPGYDVGQGSARMVASYDMRGEWAIELSVSPPLAGEPVLGHLTFGGAPGYGQGVLFHTVPVEADLARALLSELDRRLANLPERPNDWGCMHSRVGAVYRARGTERLLWGLDYCQADGEHLQPVFGRWIALVQERTAGCGGLHGEAPGDPSDLYDCLARRTDAEGL